MRCEKCGAEILDDSIICPFCETAVGKKEKTLDAIQQPAICAPQAEISGNELVGKKYELISTRYMNSKTILDSRVKSTVEVMDDRIQIDIKPRRMNVSPVIMLEDLLSIELTKKICPLYIADAILLIVLGFQIPLLFLLAAFCLWTGVNTKVVITQRNGIKVIMYSKDKNAAEKFKEDMKKISKIV